MLEKIDYPTIKETLYATKLENDMNIYLLPKSDFQEMAALLQVNFGAIDEQLSKSDNRSKEYPAGLAHFLEHKLFEMDHDQDASLKFSELGADSNAFTSFERTVFYFTSLGENQKALQLLQSFVRTINVDKKSLEREKEIIVQEIDMYLDSPDYQLYSGILANLYPNTKFSQDIAGSRESLNEITLEQLKDSHKSYYQSSNMSLFLVGSFKLESALDIIKKSQENFTTKLTKVDKIPLNLTKPIKRSSINLDVAKPKLALGFRLPEENGSLLKRKLSLRLFFSLLFGWTSQTYQNWYDQGLLDDSFDIDIEVSSRFQFVILSMDTMEPIKLANNIKSVLKAFSTSTDFNQEHLDLLKREAYGEFMRSLDDIEELANQLAAYQTKEESYLDLPEILSSIQLPDLEQLGKKLLKKMVTSEFTIFPT
ncbi:EF-P 5-aminopentanol modification-associated protein YfmH [Streptococcus tangpeifui]|uniref:EF-P 5-aminopentanol modification-associated protein YfmH n=1 Tax=Streptococcus tangpeifui TaxID=2709400 RepID=UPI0013EE3AF5|nr:MULTISPECIES: pitrilysin family protein [unclassified Streptococcus]